VPSSNLAQLKQLQRSLYDKAFKEARAIVGDSSRRILSYSAKFERSLPTRFVATTQSDVLDALKRHDIVLYGDFHTLRQSQRGLLRLVRSFVDRQRTDKVIIALEMFKHVDQDFIDGYLAGRLSEEAFLDCINYAVEWGFPWQNFKMILDFARHRKLQVMGINTDNAGRDVLAVRDRFAAKCLMDAVERFPGYKVVCLIGEYHLADDHLPKALAVEQRRRGLKTKLMRVLNNIDSYYFSRNRGSDHASTEYLRLRKDFFCIMNSPPWMKWQSFALWEEMRHMGAWHTSNHEAEFDQDIDVHQEETYDVDFQFLGFVKELAGFLQVSIDASAMESFHIHFSPRSDFLPHIVREGGFDANEATRIVGRTGVDGVYFLARTNTVLLADISINNLAEAAGQYLHTLLSGFDDYSDNKSEDFLRRVIKSSIGMVASKILNPRRKCMELHHYRQMARRQRGRHRGSRTDLRARTTHGILRFDRWMELILAKEQHPYSAVPRSLIQLDADTDYHYSRAIGQMLGFALYKKVIANKVTTTRVKRLFRKNHHSVDSIWSDVVWLYSLMHN
jgi:Haem-binding uptake, Tiki superfamily, ChaN